jgi:DNA polymerase-3 subunit epsilon
MPEAAFNVHGLSEEFLSNKPLFKDIAQDFIDFIKDSKLVIHNASFDMKFLNAELKWVNRPALPNHQAIDTLAIARRKFPGSPASLDALCRRFGIDNSSRTLHGALLDSEILAEVYLELVGGRQPDLVLSGSEVKTSADGSPFSDWRPAPRPKPLPSRLSETEKAAHDSFIAALGSDALWTKET